MPKFEFALSITLHVSMETGVYAIQKQVQLHNTNSFWASCRHQRPCRVRAGLRPPGSLPGGADQLVRFPVPTGVDPGATHAGFLAPGQELRPRHLHRPGELNKNHFFSLTRMSTSHQNEREKENLITSCSDAKKNGQRYPIPADGSGQQWRLYHPYLREGNSHLARGKRNQTQKPNVSLRSARLNPLVTQHPKQQQFFFFPFIK